MPTLEVRRDVLIATPVPKVFGLVSDLHQWAPWGPWLNIDPQATVDVAPDGKSYHWRGPRTGEGEMRIAHEQADRSIDIDLRFLEPFKSQAHVRFEFNAVEAGSTVSWTMTSALPFFFLFFVKSMKTMLGMDFDRGLRMLKDLAQTGSIPSHTEETGPTDFAGGPFLGLTSQVSLDELPTAMKRDFLHVTSALETLGISQAGPAFSLYKKWDMARAQATYTAGILLPSLPETTPVGFVTGTLPAQKTFVLTHIGPYHHLGNAWSRGMSMGRRKEFLPNKKLPPFEFYSSLNPDSDAATRTAIHFPIR